jgi:hypothetical protein
MDQTTQTLYDIVKSSPLQKERKSQLFTFLEKTGPTKEFFELLKRLILQEADGRKELFMETLREWNTAYVDCIHELTAEEQKVDDAYAQQLAHVDPWDVDAKHKALQKYTHQEKSLYVTYQKKLTTLGIQHATLALEKISSAS